MDDIIGDLPDITTTDFKEFQDSEVDIYIQAIGFEERTIGVPTKLSQLKGFKVKETLLIKYPINLEDNLFYEEDIKSKCKIFSKRMIIVHLNDDFYNNIKQKLQSSDGKNPIRVVVDFSSLSSRLILMFTRILFQFNIDLKIVYTEGQLYHPTALEAKNSVLSQTYGVGKVYISPEYSGGTKDNQDLVICFPSFNAERTETIITHIDDFILKQKDKDRLVWIVGSPHMSEEEKTKREKIQIEINHIKDDDKVYSVCTLDYKKTLRALDHIYNEIYPNYHINISDLGSKMQSFGIGLFATLRRDVSVYYSEPFKYNPAFYSEGIKEQWIIRIGDTSVFKKKLLEVDSIKGVL